MGEDGNSAGRSNLLLFISLLHFPPRRKVRAGKVRRHYELPIREPG